MYLDLYMYPNPPQKKHTNHDPKSKIQTPKSKLQNYSQALTAFFHGSYSQALTAFFHGSYSQCFYSLWGSYSQTLRLLQPGSYSPWSS